MHKLEVARFIFYIYHENGEIINDLFIKTNVRHHYKTRQSLTLFSPGDHYGPHPMKRF